MTGSHRPVASRAPRIEEPSSPGDLPDPVDAFVAQPFDVIGDEDRTIVEEVDLFPWRAICHLRVIRNDGGEDQGTGWFVGPRTVITAGHVVCPAGIFAARIAVTPGRGENRSAHPTVTSDLFETTEGWVKNQNPEHDYGAIFLDPADLSGALGFFGFATRDDDELQGTTAVIGGYATDKNEILVRAVGRLGPPEARRLHHEIDTEDGESGAPIYMEEGGSRRVVGIHTNGFPTGNIGLRVTFPVAENLRRWKNL